MDFLICALKVKETRTSLNRSFPHSTKIKKQKKLYAQMNLYMIFLNDNDDENLKGTQKKNMLIVVLAFVNAGINCKISHGRKSIDELIVAYLIFSSKFSASMWNLISLYLIILFIDSLVFTYNLYCLINPKNYPHSHFFNVVNKQNAHMNINKNQAHKLIQKAILFFLLTHKDIYEFVYVCSM
jgi:hypothetical protein